MKHKIWKLALAMSMAMGTQTAVMSPIFAAGETAKDGTYQVSVGLKNAADISKDSMAAGALVDNASLEIKEGQWFLTVELQTLQIGSMYGNVTELNYYTDYEAKESASGEIISYRNNAANSSGSNLTAVEKVRIPVTPGSDGIYVNIVTDIGMSPDAYIAIDASSIYTDELSAAVAKAETVQAGGYTAASYQKLAAAIKDARAALNTSDTSKAQELIAALQNAEASLVKVYSLADGTYEVSATVYKADSDTASMAAKAVRGAYVKAEGNKLNVHVLLQPMSMYGATAAVEKMEVQGADGTYKEAAVEERDASGNISEVSFPMDENAGIVNVQFYYGGSTTPSQARLVLGLDAPKAVQTSRFESDGTYSLNVALWNATSDKESMANGAFVKGAAVIVKNGKAYLYVSTQKMTMGTITAYLQEMTVEGVKAQIVKRNAENQPSMFMFELPHEEEYISVLVNPMVAMMGNQDIPARIKMDWSSLKKVSDATELKTENTETETKDPVQTDTKQPQKTENSTTAVKKKPTAAAAKPTAVKTEAVNTGDETRTGLIGGLSLLSLGAALLLKRKREC